MEISEKVIVGNNVKNASATLEKLRKEQRVNGIMLIFVRRGSKNIMEIMSFKEYQKQIKRTDYVLVSISSDREDSFMIVENLMDGYFSKNERYSADDFLSFINSAVRSELYEIILTGNKRDMRSPHNSVYGS